MALEIRSIPVLTGETAERFVKEADENARNPKKDGPRFMSRARFEEIERRRILRLHSN